MNSNSFHISGKIVGGGAPALIIAEIGQAHDGSLGIAHSYIEAVANSGADAIKFQTHIAIAESTPGEPFRVNFSYEDASRYEYWERMEFTEKQWQGLAEHCAELGLIFLSSPFSLEALDLLNRLNVPAWKVGSGEVNNPLMLKAMAQTGKPILLSSGMSTWAEIEESISAIKKLGVDVALFQCTSKYPTDLTDVGLNVLDDMRNRFSVPVGLSDHSGSQYPALAALARGVDLVEIHVVFSKEMFGPDTQASITISELGQLVKARDAFHTLLNYPVDKDAMANELSQMRKLFNKSVAVTKDATKGQIITRDLLTVKKPGTGIPAKNLERCIGKTLRNNITANQLLTWKDIEAL